VRDDDQQVLQSSDLVRLEHFQTNDGVCNWGALHYYTHRRKMELKPKTWREKNERRNMHVLLLKV
jgi:hypothetical protein